MAGKAVAGTAVALGVLFLAGYIVGFYFIQQKWSSNHGLLWWMTGWAAATVSLSGLWLAVNYKKYDEKQRARILRTHFQDWLLAALMPGLAQAFDKAGRAGPGTMADPVGWLLPLATLWFTLETKMLTHMWVGTPFHPTWWVDNECERWAPSNLVNLTFSVSTALITAVLTTYAAIAMLVEVGGGNLWYDGVTWKFACTHGTTIILHSGLWMIIASSGVPALAPIPQMAFMAVPPIIRANPHTCVIVHKADLVFGLVMLFLGGFLLEDGPEGLEYTVKIIVAIFWICTLAAKVSVHVKTWGYKAPYEEKKKEAEAVASAEKNQSSSAEI